VRVDAPHLRIISDDLWAAAHAQMRAKKPASGETVERKKGGRPATYLLSGLTKCGVCGGALTVIGGRDGTKPIKVYACAYRHDRGDAVCANSHRRPVERVNAGVVDWIKSNILSDELVLDTLKEAAVRPDKIQRQAHRGAHPRLPLSILQARTTHRSS
jgi:site-specific DNA recombinase